MTAESMDSSDLKVPFGRRGDELVGPGDVAETGLACGCLCPGCGAALLIRQGGKRRHFSHFNAPGSPLCVERAIHAAGIQVLLEARRLTVPAHVIHVEKIAVSGRPVVRACELQAQEMIVFEACNDEVTLSGADAGTIRVDVVGYYGEKALLIEIRFTHAVDADKLAKVAQHDHAMIEIDVSDLRFDGKLASLQQRILDDLDNKLWLYHPASASTVQRLSEQVDADVRILNEEYESDRARWRRTEAERAAKENLLRRVRQRRADAAEAARHAALVEKVTAYRNKPVHEKEGAILRRLGVTGPWPEHLSVHHPKNRAFPGPYRLWQAAVFHKFIFQRSLSQIIGSHQVAEWVKQWFGDSSSEGPACYNAVTAYLEYLVRLGFLHYRDVRYGHASFFIGSNKLDPPKPSEEACRPSRFTPPAPYVVPHDPRPLELRWKADWPDYTKLRSAITKRRDRSNVAELELLYVLFARREDLPSPTEFAEWVEHDFPAIQVLVFLRSFGFTEEVRVG